MFTKLRSHDRSSHQMCSRKKDVLENFTNFTGKHLCWSFFSLKLRRPPVLVITGAGLLKLPGKVAGLLQLPTKVAGLLKLPTKLQATKDAGLLA